MTIPDEFSHGGTVLYVCITQLICPVLKFKHTVGHEICSVGLKFSIIIATVLHVCTVQYYVYMYSTVRYSTTAGILWAAEFVLWA